MPHELHEANRRSWNAATRVHNTHKGDQAAFFRQGGSTLHPEETRLLGELTGQRLIHLQCNAGQDTLSLAQHGAEVTGVDISDDAIAFATQLAADADIPATFLRSDLFDWLDAAAGDPSQRYDVAFASYGALCWLSDIRRWAQGAARILKSGGRLVVVEFHPVLQILEERDAGWVACWPYSSNGIAIAWPDGVDDYVAPAFPESGDEPRWINPHPCHEWEWGIADVLGAVLDAGLHIERFEEYFWCNGFKPFASMIEVSGRERCWKLPPTAPPLPLMYGFVARKPC